jgi:hypothetical protein
MGKAIGNFIGGITGANQLRGAADTAAQQQREAALASVFRPVGMSSRFGTSKFGYETVGGIPRVSSAEYTVAPELLAIQNQLFGLTPFAAQQAADAQQASQQIGAGGAQLFGLGQQYLAQSPEMARQQFFNEQMALLAPARQAEEQRLASSVFGRGRAGLNIGGAQPELASLAGARRMQELQLAAQSEQAAQQRQSFGAGLMGQGLGLFGQQYALPGQALAPLQSYLGTIGTLEEMGQQPLQLGLQIGGAAQQGASAASSLLSQAAQTQYGGAKDAANANAQVLAGLFQAGASAAMKASDIRTKENIKQVGKLTNGLNVYQYEYKSEFKDSPYAGHGVHVGVMAHEVEKIIPEAVFTTEYGYKAVDYSLIH